MVSADWVQERAFAKKSQHPIIFLFKKLKPIFDLQTIFDDFSAISRSTKSIHLSLLFGP
jgi:hypothetical protein